MNQEAKGETTSDSFFDHIASATDAVLQGMTRTPKIDGALFRTGARRVEANSGTSAKGRFLAADSASPQATMQPSAAAASVDRSYLTRSTATHRQQVHDEVLAAWNLESAEISAALPFLP